MNTSYQNISRNESLYTGLAALFCLIVIISNIITVRLFPAPFASNLPLSAGLITYPLSFLIGGVVTEIFGPKRAKFMVFLGFFTSLVSFCIIGCARLLPAINQENETVFNSIFEINGLALFSSMLAYGIAQLIEIQVFASLKQLTNSKYLWLRNNVSTLLSQIIDTFIVNGIIFYWGFQMELDQVLLIIGASYLYKIIFSISNTPLFYLLVKFAKNYLKTNLQQEMIRGIHV